MFKWLLFGSRLLIALAVLYVSLFVRHPFILYLSLGWCVWLWLRMPGWKARALIFTGFGLAAAGWWVGQYETFYYLLRVEASHINEEAHYWVYLAHVSFFTGMGLMTAGVLLLAFVDFWRLRKMKEPPEPVAERAGTAEPGTIWPPTPRHPH